LTAKLRNFWNEHKEVVSYITMGVTEKNISEPDTERRIQKVINCLNSLYNLLIQYKSTLSLEIGIPLVFENKVSAGLAHLINDVCEKFTLVFSTNKYQLNFDLIKAQLKLHLLCHNHTCYLKNEEIAQHDKIEFVIDCYLGLVATSLHLGQLAKAEYYLQKEKKIINFFKADKFSTQWLFLAGNYSLMANLCNKKGDYINAKEYALKFNSFTAKMAEKGIIFDIEAYKAYMDFMQLAYKSSRFDKAVFWAKIALSHCENVIILTQKNKADVIDSAVKDFEGKIKNIKSLIQVFKSKLFLQKQQELKLLLNDYPFTLNENRPLRVNQLLPGSKTTQTTSIKIHEDNEIVYLLNLLRKLYIVCQFDVNTGSINIYNLNDINIKSIKNALEDWKRYVALKVSKQEIVSGVSNSLAPPASMPLTKDTIHVTEDLTKTTGEQGSQKSTVITSAIASFSISTDHSLKDEVNTAAEIDPKKDRLIKRKNMPSDDNAEASSSEQNAIKQNKVIIWGESYPSYFRGNNSVFKLRGDIKRHYLTIKPELLAEVSQKNPRAAKNLLQICERGKQLGDSRGDKGVLIKGDKAKAKDSSKPYRFFGRVVATTTDEKGKIRTLIEFNGWTEDHKQKVPSEITPPTCKKNIRPRNQ
jgi:hypothetical protein